MISRKTLLAHTAINLFLFILAVVLDDQWLMGIATCSMGMLIWLLVFFFSLIGQRDRLFDVLKAAYEKLPDDHKPEIEEMVFKAGFCPNGVLDDELEPR